MALFVSSDPLAVARVAPISTLIPNLSDQSAESGSLPLNVPRAPHVWAVPPVDRLSSYDNPGEAQAVPVSSTVAPASGGGGGGLLSSGNGSGVSPWLLIGGAVGLLYLLTR